MKPERWRRVEALYNEMRARPPDERGSALAAACPDDPELVAEVQSLLDQPDSAADFLNSPALEIAARLASGTHSTLTGRRIGVFEVQGLLGVGGMGEVYRARDTRLGRSVALKILPRVFREDSGRRVRFEREARVLASLSHPHICALHDVGREGDTSYIVMELVEGETLAARLKKGALPLEQTLRIAIEIADALDKAHRQGVIHRDLKPGNVMLTKSGSKLMDFGLAKLTLVPKDAEAISALPTALEPLTGDGTLMGTVPYMSPEQLEGKAPDARSDIWALGCLLYEMATGRPAFAGKNQASLISTIMAAAPTPTGQIQPLTPPSLDRLVRVCLARDPDDRLQTAHDVMQELKWIAEAPTDVQPVTGHGSIPDRRRVFLIGGIALLCLILGVFLDRRLLAPTPSRPPVVHSFLDVSPADALRAAPWEIFDAAGQPRPSRTAIALSPDGQRLVFAAQAGGRQQLYLRVFAQAEAKPLPGTDGAWSPFFSPDGRWIGFQADGSIRKISLDGGGPPVELCPVTGSDFQFGGAGWGSNDGIVFATLSGGLQRVSSAGGKPEPLTTLGASEVSHRLPHALPGGRAVLFTVFESQFDTRAARVEVLDLHSGERRVVIENATDARYIQPGYVVFARRGTLMAVPFDPVTLHKTGGEFGVLDDVMHALNGSNILLETGAAQFTLSLTGTLAYIAGGMIPSRERRLVWVDRLGAVRALDTPAHSYISPRLSPDGRRVAVHARENLTRVLWVLDLARGTLTRPVPDPEGAMLFPRWTPNGRQVAFHWEKKGEGDLFLADADGGTSPERLTHTKASPDNPLGLIPSSWHPDGRRLVYIQGRDTWLLSRGSGAWSSRALMEAKAAEAFGELSPDGRWLAYASDETGRGEVYVRGFPDLNGKVQVSSQGGTSPLWSRNGRELFYLGGVDQMRSADLIAVDVRLRPELWIGAPHRLFSIEERRLDIGGPVTAFDVSADGQRFLFAQNIEVPTPPPVARIHLITNWVEEMKARVAAGQVK